MTNSKALKKVLSSSMASWAEMNSSVNWQKFFPEFSAYHVGMALYFLGSRNIKYSYSTSEMSAKKLEINEQKALLLLSGEKGLINLKF